MANLVSATDNSFEIVYLNEPFQKEYQSFLNLTQYTHSLTSQEQNRLTSILSQLFKIEPKHSDKKQKLPTITFTFDELNKVLIEKLGTNIIDHPWLIGGGSLFVLGGKHNPSDTDICYYLKEPIFDLVFGTLVKFIEFKITSSTLIFKQDKNLRYIIEEEYFTIKTKINRNVAIYSLGDKLDIQFVADKNHRNFIAIHEGLQVAISPLNSSSICKNFNDYRSEDDYNYAIQSLMNLRYEVENPETIHRFFYRLVLKITQGYNFTLKLSSDAFQKMLTEDPSAKGYKRPFLLFREYQQKHYPKNNKFGRIFNFLNFLLLSKSAKNQQGLDFCKQITSVWRADRDNHLLHFSNLAFDYHELIEDFLYLAQGLYLLYALKNQNNKRIAFIRSNCGDFPNRIQITTQSVGPFVFEDVSQLVLPGDPIDLLKQLILSWIKIENKLQQNKVNYDKFLNISSELVDTPNQTHPVVNLSAKSRTEAISNLIRWIYEIPFQIFLNQSKSNPFEFVKFVESLNLPLNDEDRDFIQEKKFSNTVLSFFNEAEGLKNTTGIRLLELLKTAITSKSELHKTPNIKHIFTILNSLSANKSQFLTPAFISFLKQCFLQIIKKISTIKSLTELDFFQEVMLLLIESKALNLQHKVYLLEEFYLLVLLNFRKDSPEQILSIHKFSKKILKTLKEETLRKIVGSYQSAINQLTPHYVEKCFEKGQFDNALYLLAASVDSKEYLKDTALACKQYFLLADHVVKDTKNRHLSLFAKLTLKLFAHFDLDDSDIDTLMSLANKMKTAFTSDANIQIYKNLLEKLSQEKKTAARNYSALFKTLGHVLINESNESAKVKGSALLNALKKTDGIQKSTAIAIEQIESDLKAGKTVLKNFIKLVIQHDVFLAFTFASSTNLKSQLSDEEYSSIHWFLILSWARKIRQHKDISQELWHKCVDHTKGISSFTKIYCSLVFLHFYVSIGRSSLIPEIVNFNLPLLASLDIKSLSDSQVKELKSLLEKNTYLLIDKMPGDLFSLVEEQLRIAALFLDMKLIKAYLNKYLDKSVELKILPSLLFMNWVFLKLSENSSPDYTAKTTAFTISLLKISEANIQLIEHSNFLINTLISLIPPHSKLSDSVENLVYLHLERIAKQENLSKIHYLELIDLLDTKKLINSLSEKFKFFIFDLLISHKEYEILESLWPTVKPTEETPKNTVYAYCEKLGSSKNKGCILKIWKIFLALEANDATLYSIYLKGIISLNDPTFFKSIIKDFETFQILQPRHISQTKSLEASECFAEYRKNIQEHFSESNADVATMLKLIWQIAKSNLEDAANCIAYFSQYTFLIANNEKRTQVIDYYARKLFFYRNELIKHTNRNDYLDAKNAITENLISVLCLVQTAEHATLACKLFATSPKQSANIFIKILHTTIVFPETSIVPNLFTDNDRLKLNSNLGRIRLFTQLMRMQNVVLKKDIHLFSMSGKLFQEYLFTIQLLQKCNDYRLDLAFNSFYNFLKGLLAFEHKPTKRLNFEKQTQELINNIFATFWSQSFYFKSDEPLRKMQELAKMCVSTKFKSETYLMLLEVPEFTYKQLPLIISKMKIIIRLKHQFLDKCLESLFTSFYIKFTDTFNALIESNDSKVLKFLNQGFELITWLDEQRIEIYELDAKGQKLSEFSTNLNTDAFLVENAFNLFHTEYPFSEKDSIQLFDNLYRLLKRKMDVEKFFGFLPIIVEASSDMITHYYKYQNEHSLRILLNVYTLVMSKNFIKNEEKDDLIVDVALLYFCLPIIMRTAKYLFELNFPNLPKNEFFQQFQACLKDEESIAKLHDAPYFANVKPQLRKNTINQAIIIMRKLDFTAFNFATSNAIQMKLNSLIDEFLILSNNLLKVDGVAIKFNLERSPFLVDVENHPGFSPEFRTLCKTCMPDILKKLQSK